MIFLCFLSDHCIIRLKFIIMVKYILFVALGVFQLNVYSQKINIDDLLLIKQQYVSKLNEETNTGNTLKLQMDFNSPVIINPKDINVLKGLSVLKVELYYTAFQVSNRFDQPKLNRQRLENLKKLLPELFNQTFVVWEFKGQSDCKNDDIARGYFHGFVITYKPKLLLEDTRKEIADIKSVIHSDSLGYDSVYTVYETRLRKKKVKSGYYLPMSTYKKVKGIVYEKKSIFKRQSQMVVKIDTIKRGRQYHKFVKSKNAMSFVKRNLSDSTIFAVLRRNESWKDIAFVCDVTGSMSAYTTELMIWYKLNSLGNRTNYFTFFNDGDAKPEKKKKIGSIGGIYNINAGNYEAVALMIEQAMKAGNGGDAPENNCEALIEAMRKSPDSKEFVMIADNFANVKDIELIKKIQKPVHIIICGTGGFIVNTDYLDLARATGGSIHSLEQDLENLLRVNEGQTLNFGGHNYVLRNGKFQKALNI